MNNTNKLVEIALNAKVDHPRMKGYYTGFDGTGRILPGTGGITYDVKIGDNCMDLVGDHVEPGISMANPGGAENKAVMSLSCIGNPVKVLGGPAAGAVGYVTGKHGGVNHVMAWFAPEDLEKMTGKEEFLIRAKGQGLVEGGIEWMNLDPKLVKEILANDGKLKAAKIIPSALIGAGLGSASVLDGDIDLMTQDPVSNERYKLDELRFGDVVAIEDLYCKFGPHHKENALSLGVITHSDSYSAGHGPGLTIICTLDENPGIELDENANLASFFERME